MNNPRKRGAPALRSRRNTRRRTSNPVKSIFPSGERRTQSPSPSFHSPEATTAINNRSSVANHETNPVIRASISGSDGRQGAPRPSGAARSISPYARNGVQRGCRLARSRSPNESARRDILDDALRPRSHSEDHVDLPLRSEAHGRSRGPIPSSANENRLSDPPALTGNNVRPGSLRIEEDADLDFGGAYVTRAGGDRVEGRAPALERTNTRSNPCVSSHRS